MGALEQIDAARATAKLSVAKAIGTQIQFSHRGGLAVTLYANPLGQSILKERSGGMMGVVTEVRAASFEIPVQTGFARTTGDTEPITPGDVITWMGRHYDVLDPIEKSKAGFIYTVKCAERKRLASGA